jgi:hypothetical protein
MATTAHDPAGVVTALAKDALISGGLGAVVPDALP